MHWVNAVYISAALSLSGSLIYFVRRIFNRKNNEGSEGKRIDFHPNIGFTRQDGYQSVAVILENESDVYVWAEEIEIALTDLIANQQTSEAPCCGIHRIHQHVQPHDELPISIVEAIYNSAGRPQRKYSCVLSSVVRFRVGEKWYEELMKTYKLKMIGLTVASIHRERRTVHQFKARDRSHDHQKVETPSR